MVLLLRFEFVDFVACAGPALVIQLPGDALLDDPPVPAAIEYCGFTRGWDAAPEGRQPMAVIVGFVGAADADHAKLGGIERADQLFERGPLARTGPAFEQDDRPLAMDDLGSLQARQPVLQRRNDCIGIAIERFLPFKFC